MRTLTLDSELLRSLIETRGLGIASFSDRIRVNRSTFHRWLKTRWLPSVGRVLDIAAELDVDPLSLWSMSPREFELILPDLTRVAREGKWKSHYPALQFAEDYLFPKGDWPPPIIPSRYGRRGRSWRFWEYAHTSMGKAKGRYASIVISAPGDKFVDPQLWHFAYREVEPVKRPWFPYGVVRLHGRELALFNYIGEAEATEVEANCKRIVVETYLGTHPLEFRIASLHPFDASIRPRHPRGLPVVGFRYPGPR